MKQFMHFSIDLIKLLQKMICFRNKTTKRAFEKVVQN